MPDITLRAAYLKQPLCEEDMPIGKHGGWQSAHSELVIPAPHYALVAG